MGLLDSLLVDLEVSSAKLQAGVNSAIGYLSKLGDAASAIDKKLNGFLELQGIRVGAEAIKGLTEFVLKGSEAAEQLQKLSAAAGESVAVFSRQSAAFALSGGSSEELGKALEKLNKNLGLAGAGSQQQVALFKALGVSVKDASGAVRPTAAVFADMAKTFDGFAAGASKSALEMEVFGKTGAELDQALHEMANGSLEALGDQAERVGLILDEKTTAAAKEFGDNFKKLDMIVENVGTRVAAELAPALSKLTDELLNNKAFADGLKETVQALAGAFRVFASAVIFLSGALRESGASLAGNAAIMERLGHADFSGALEVSKDLLTELGKISGDTERQLSAMWKSGSQGAAAAGAQLGSVLAVAKPSADAALRQAQGWKLAAEGMKALNKVLDEYGKKSADITSAEDPLAEITYRLDKGDLARDLAKVGKQADEMRQKILDAAESLHELELGKLNVKLELEISRAAASSSAGAARQQESLQGVQKGFDPTVLSGFVTYGEAAAEALKQLHEAAQANANAQMFEGQKAYEAASNELIAADAHKRLADEANAAATTLANVAKTRIQLTFENKLSGNAVDFSAAQRKQGFENIGKPQTAIWSQLTDGFKDFNDALAKSVEATKAAADETGKAKSADMIGDIDGMHAAQLRAQADTEAADKANQAASAFEQMKSAGSDWVGGLKVLGEAFTKNLGDLGKTIDDTIKGFQQGGIWGALAALVMDLLSMMDGWKDIQNIAQGQLKMALKDMAGGLNSVIDALKPLMGAVESIASALHGLLDGVLDVVAKVLSGIAPLFQTIGVSLQALLAPVGTLLQIVGGILDPLLKLMGITLEPLVLIFMALKVGVDYVSLGFNMLVDAIDKGLIQGINQFIDSINSVFQSHLDHLSGIGVNNAGGIVNATTQLANDMAQLKQFADDMINDPLNAQDDFARQSAAHAEAMGNDTDQVNKNATAMAKFNQEFSNVPTGIKTALLMFNAANADDGSSGSSNSGSGSGSSSGGGGFGPPIHVHVAGSVVVEKDLIQGIKQALNQDVGNYWGSIIGHHP